MKLEESHALGRTYREGRGLLAHLHKLLVLGWRQKIQSRARVRIAIEDELGEGLQPYTEEHYHAKCNILFEHVYESYQDEGRSVFEANA